MSRLRQVQKLDGRLVPFEREKLADAIFRAAQAAGGEDRFLAEELAGVVLVRLERKSGPIEFSIDRTGGDLRNMDVSADPTGSVCGQACEAESRCRAWTYVRPGYLGPSARCFLKERLTAPRRKPCCVSGVVR